MPLLSAMSRVLNLRHPSIVTTVDLPEGAYKNTILAYDDYLISHQDRSAKQSGLQPNIRQIYADSTTMDFSELEFNAAFIDGGHDYDTVKSDSFNVINRIRTPGVILWHDYDVVNPVGVFLRELAKQYVISHILGTRLCIAQFT